MKESANMQVTEAQYKPENPSDQFSSPQRSKVEGNATGYISKYTFIS